MTNKILFSLVVIFSLSTLMVSCKLNSDKIDIQKKDTLQQKEPARVTETKSTPLEGTWTSADDEKYLVQIKSNEWTDFYVGERPEAFKFSISDSCVSSPNEKTNNSGKYITIFDKSGNRCYYIVNVDPLSLELSYVGRGNTLKFKKKK